jgi:Tfp pilus assembly protein PilV
VTYFLFDHIPGQHPTYTVAVLATNATDARRHMRATWRGGKLCSTVARGEVKADCGAVTDAAAEAIHERMERECCSNAGEARL